MIDAKNMLVFILLIDAILFLGGTAVAEISGANFYGLENTLIQEADAGDGTMIVKEAGESDIPGATSGVDPETGGFFTDLFRSARNWLLSTTGVAYVIGFINALPNFLAVIGLPQAVVFTLGAIWHIMGVFALANFLWGK